jgi:ABC-type dipeptide/oligopeptide/nickel transport system permease component
MAIKRLIQLLLLFFALSAFAVSITSCSKQQKAERAVSKFIKKFSTNPDTYESIEFLQVERNLNEHELAQYQISHMYRIVGADGQKKVLTHTFSLTEHFNVFVKPFEQFD